MSATKTEALTPAEKRFRADLEDYKRTGFRKPPTIPQRMSPDGFDSIPTWQDANDKRTRGETLTALESYVLDYEPNEYPPLPNGFAARFRRQLSAVVDQVRSAGTTVKKVK